MIPFPFSFLTKIPPPPTPPPKKNKKKQTKKQKNRGMVQTKEQYTFIYRVAEDALESLLKNGTSVLNENWKNEGKAAAAFLNVCIYFGGGGGGGGSGVLVPKEKKWALG